MNIAFFSSRNYEKGYLTTSNNQTHNLIFTEDLLNVNNASSLKNIDVVSVFTNDDVSAEVLESLRSNGIRHVSIRAAGYNNVDIKRAKELNISVANVPQYSPYAVAEHTVTLMLALNRKLQLVRKRVEQFDFTLNGLEGFDMNGKTIGIVGMGKIGSIVAKIMHGFGCTVLAYDVMHNEEYIKKFGVVYCSLEELIKKADIITLHTPLLKQTEYMINKSTIEKMKKGVMLINTGRGGLLNTSDVIEGLKSGKIGSLGMDVYEKEKGVFFYDHSKKPITDNILLELTKMDNVIVTPHMAFLTTTALRNIADTTFKSINQWALGLKSETELT